MSQQAYGLHLTYSQVRSREQYCFLHKSGKREYID